MRQYLFSRRGQATTETVLLFPIIIIFMIFIIKIFGLLILNQKMEIAAFYAARRYQLQSHVTAYYQRWDRRHLQKDIEDKVKEYLGFGHSGMMRFLSLQDMKIMINQEAEWTQVRLLVTTKPPKIPFLCKYNKLTLCENDLMCLKGFAFLCETGGKIEMIKYVGPNERVIPYVRPEGK